MYYHGIIDNEIAVEGLLSTVILDFATLRYLSNYDFSQYGIWIKKKFLYDHIIETRDEPTLPSPT